MMMPAPQLPEVFKVLTQDYQITAKPKELRERSLNIAKESLSAWGILIARSYIFLTPFGLKDPVEFFLR